MWQRSLALPFLVLGAACGIRDPDFGSGPITLSRGVQANFEEYQARDAPVYFAVSESGLGSYYIYCHGGFNCTDSAARMMVLDRCRRHNPGEECKIYAVGRSVVWQEADARRAAQAALSPGDRLVRECLDAATPAARIDRCSHAIAAAELAQDEKRGAFYVRGRAYEQIGDFSKAELDYQAVLGIDPDHGPAKARLAGLIAPAAPPGAISPQNRRE
jgi:tetratricopeptide (TPR) repeat protein